MSRKHFFEIELSQTILKKHVFYFTWCANNFTEDINEIKLAHSS